MSIIKDLTNNSLINPPNFVKNNIYYEVIMGSVAYGCNKNTSDIDIYGFCIPSREILYPHEFGYIKGFGKQIRNFEQYQIHHIYDVNKKTEYDLNIFNIVKYFQLCMENNPNMIDSLFVPKRCILNNSDISNYLRENRYKFLSKAAYHKFKGYAYSQLNKCTNKAIHKMVKLCKKNNIKPEELNDNNIHKYNIPKLQEYYKEANKSGNISKRLNGIIKYGYDVKFAYHIVRLLNEVEQILQEEDINLERDKEQYKSIRRGDLSLEQIKEYFISKEKYLEELYQKSKLRYSCNEDEIKQILFNCIDMHYHDNKNGIDYSINNKYKNMIDKIKEIIN